MKKLKLALMISLLMFISCNKEDSNPTGSATEPPQPPAHILPAANSTDIVTPTTLSWNASSGAIFYMLQVSPVNDFSTLTYDNNVGNVTSKQINLSKGYKYYWRIAAANSIGQSAYSSAWSFTTGYLPGTPNLISPKNDSTFINIPSTILVWDTSSGAVSYTLQVSTDYFNSFIYNDSNLTTTSKEITGLKHSTKYYWRVRAKNSHGYSNYSNYFSFSTVTSPNPPILNSPGNGSVGVNIPVTLKWNNSPGANSYTLQISKDYNFSSFIINDSSLTTTSKEISGLNHSTKYYWRVKAANNYGSSNFSNEWSFTTIEGIPGVPTLLSPTDGASDQALSIELKWNAVQGTNSYTLQVSSNSSFSNYIFNQSGLTATSRTISGLNDSTTYYWRVSATNSYGTSNYSSVWSFSTYIVEAPVPCPGIPTVTYEGKTYNTVKIKNQCWLKENLNVGTRINGTNNQTDNVTIEKYCSNDLESNCDTYGGLYQWNEAMQYSIASGTKGICPTGWHIPTLAEFQTLKTSAHNEGNSLKAVGQGTGNGAGTNTSGFSALLAGYRGSDGNFYGLGDDAYFWSSTEIGSDSAYYLDLDYNGSNIGLYRNTKVYGFSVRCVKD